MWSWGSNTYGQLGDNTNTHRSSPTQVGAGTKWLGASGGPEGTSGGWGAT